MLDEPTASLDVLATADIEELLLEVGRELPLIMVTHNPEQAARLAFADTVAVMAGGTIINQVGKDEFFSSGADGYFAGIKSDSLNVSEAFHRHIMQQESYKIFL